MDEQLGSNLLIIPRGRPGLPQIKLDMTSIYGAEKRLGEVALVGPRTGPELMASFNEAANTTTKYLSWIKYEVLTAEKELGLAKAEVILDKLPEFAEKLRSSGLKNNEDFRSALISKDTKCSDLTEKLNTLNAIYELLDNKARSFIRAYSAVKSVSGLRDFAPTARINATPGMLMDEDGFMGISKIGDNNG